MQIEFHKIDMLKLLPYNISSAEANWDWVYIRFSAKVKGVQIKSHQIRYGKQLELHKTQAKH